MIRDQAKMNLACHCVYRLSGNYFKSCKWWSVFIIFKFKLKSAVIRLLVAWWWVCDVNVLNLSLLNRSQLLVSSLRSYVRSQDHKKHNLKRRKKKCWVINLPVKLRLSALTSRTRQEAARGSPRWRPPNLKFRVTLYENFIGLESSLEAEISMSSLPFV